MVDVMHCVDQGVASHIIANALYHFQAKVWGTNEQAFSHLAQDMDDWYKNRSATKGKNKVQGEWNQARIKKSG